MIKLTVPGTSIPLTKQVLQRYRAECRLFGQAMVEVDASKGGNIAMTLQPSRCWRSRKYLASLYKEPGKPHRLSVLRCEIDLGTGRWKDGITWDELQRVKSECGFGDQWAVECFPPDAEVIDVANIRHLWLLSEAPSCAWVGGAKASEGGRTTDKLSHEKNIA